MYNKRDVLDVNLSEVSRKLGIELNDMGNYYSAKCPFHDDSVDSLIIYDNIEKKMTGFWKCFACQFQGDSIELVQRYNKQTFQEALTWIGDTFNLEKEALTPRQKMDYAIRLDVEPLAKEAVSWFIKQRNQKFYGFMEDRGFTEEIADEFEFGFSLNDSHSLKQHLFDKGFTNTQLISSGLFNKKPSGIEPIFYNRVMLPMRDKSGGIVGWVGRALNGDDDKKYITKTASFINKGGVTYGLYNIRNENPDIDTVFISEGNLDVPKMFQETNWRAVSVMGTTIRRNHITDMVSCLPSLRRVVISLDGDDAGRKGIKKFIENVYLEDDFYYKDSLAFFVLELPDGDDLDSIVSRSSEEFYEIKKNNMIDIISYYMNILRKEYSVNEKSENDEYVSKCLKLIATTSDFRSSTYLDTLSKKSNYSIERLNKEIYIYKVQYQRIVRKKYEKKFLRYLVREDIDEKDKSDLIKFVGAPLEKILSRTGMDVSLNNFDKYASKVTYMSVMQDDEICFDEAVFYGLLILATDLYSIILEYRTLNKSNTLKLNKKTKNEIHDIQKLYKTIMKKVIRRLDV